MFFTAKAAAEQGGLYSALAVCQTVAMLSQLLLLPPEQPANKLRGKHLGQDILEGRWRRLALVGVFLAQRPVSRRWFPWAGWNLDGCLLTSDPSGQGYCAAPQKTRKVKMGD